MKVQFKLIESNKDIRAKIFKAMIQHLDVAINKSMSPIKSQIKNIISDSLTQQPEYQSLKSGALRYEFGIADSSSVDSIVNLIIDTINIQKNVLKSSNKGISGGFKLTCLSINELENIIQSSSASVIDNERGYSLPWLRWLLFEGVKPIVKGYEVQIGPSLNSRTGMALMVQSSTNWRVPAEFAGTVTNNWITRAIEENDKAIISIIQKNIENNI